MQGSRVASSLVAAHADRLLELVHLCDPMARAAATSGADGAPTHQVLAREAVQQSSVLLRDAVPPGYY